MTEFLLAALPWIAIGLSLAIVTVNYSRTKKAANEVQDPTEAPSAQDADKQDSYLSIGMSLGMCFGVALGSAGIVPLSYGISFGMLVGMAAGMLIKKK